MVLRASALIILIPVATTGEFVPLLPPLVRFIPSAVSAVLNLIQTRNIENSIQALSDYADKIASQSFSTIAAIWWAANEEQGAWGYVQRKAKDTGAAFTELQDDSGQMWTHLYTRVLPHSLAHLEGKVGAEQIGPLHRYIKAVAVQADANLKQINSLLGWQKNYVNPLLSGWREFIKWWDGNFSEPAVTLIDWLQKPEDFAKWAAPPLAGALVAYYADPQHKRTRDNLTLTIVDAWSETPNRVLDAVLTWLTTSA